MNSDAPDIFVQSEYHLTPPELSGNSGQNIHGSAYSDVVQDCATPVISPPVGYISDQKVSAAAVHAVVIAIKNHRSFQFRHALVSDDRESPYRVICEQVDKEYEAVENGSPAVRDAHTLLH